MKMSYLARLCGLPRTASEKQITDALERGMTRANVAPGQTYASPQLASASATDVSRDSLDWVVRSITPHSWIIYRRENGAFKPWGSESSDLDALQKIVAKKNLEAKTKANEARDGKIRDLVNEQMTRGHDYESAWSIVKRQHKALFANMTDPAPAQAAAARPKSKR